MTDSHPDNIIKTITEEISNNCVYFKNISNQTDCPHIANCNLQRTCRALKEATNGETD